MIQITKGVLPVPPTKIFPTTMTGTGKIVIRKIPNAYSAKRVTISRLKIKDSGHNKQAITPRRCQAVNNTDSITERGDDIRRPTSLRLIFVFYWFVQKN